MRDPKRIDPIIDRIRNFWKAYPELRLGQILTNAIGGKFDDSKLFYIEDDVLEKVLIAYEKKVTKGTK